MNAPRLGAGAALMPGRQGRLRVGPSISSAAGLRAGGGLGARQGAFSLVEMLGVLAIVVVLLVVVAENVLTRIKRANLDAEAISSTTVASTLKTAIAKNKSVPAATNFAQTAASYLSLSINRVTTTVSGNPRLFLVDPNFRVGTNGWQTLPYTQGNTGSIQPTNARVILLSSVGLALPTISPDAATFSDIWSTPLNGVPSGWPASWANRGQDLRILRMDLGNLFHRVVLENLDMFSAAPYSVETTNTLTTVPAGSRREMWLIDTTVMNLHFANNTLQGREYVVEDVSYTYENGRWGRYVRYGPNNTTAWFGQMVDQFLRAPPPPGMTRRYSNQQWIVDAMYTFLYDFGQWSLDDFSAGPPWPHTPGYEQASAGASGLSSYSSDLIWYY